MGKCNARKWVNVEHLVMILKIHLKSKTSTVYIVRSNTLKVHSSVTPSAARQLNRRLHPHVGI